MTDAPKSAGNCGSCRFWSQWLSTTGDCMAYPYKRREAMMRWDTATQGPFDAAWPAKSAHDTQADDSCDQFELSTARG